MHGPSPGRAATCARRWPRSSDLLSLGVLEVLVRIGGTVERFGHTQFEGGVHESCQYRHFIAFKRSTNTGKNVASLERLVWSRV